jgi:hypothetical protein
VNWAYLNESDRLSECDMGEILAFHQPKTSLRASREAVSASAEIIFFPGIRYERMEETFLPPKPAVRRTARRREKPKKEKAS